MSHTPPAPHFGYGTFTFTLFHICLWMSWEQQFPDKDDLLRNMMGLMGNIAEVDYLRPHLMKQEYVSIFRSVSVVQQRIQ